MRKTVRPSQATSHVTPSPIPSIATSASRPWRGPTKGFLLALGYSTQRGYGRVHPFVGEVRIGLVDVDVEIPDLGFAVRVGSVRLTECQMVAQFTGSAAEPARFTRGYGLVFGQSERKAMAMSLVDRALRADEFGEERRAPAQDEEFVLEHCDNVAGDRLHRAPQAAALRRLPGRARARENVARRADGAGTVARDRRGRGRVMSAPPPAYNFAYLDEGTKRMIRRAILKGIAIPGYQVPFASREMPMPYGWGTGGVQVTAAILGPRDVLKVIDQGADDTTNAVSIRAFFQRTADVATTTEATRATIIQTRHRIPETPLRAGQTIVYQVPIPEPLRFLEPRETETRRMHALAEYGLMHVKLYEDITRHGHIATTFAYPVAIEGRYVMDPSPIPKFDNPKMHRSPALQLFGAGREKRIYALPPFTDVRSLDFEDHPFAIQRFRDACALCDARDAYLDEIITDDSGGRMFVCSDTDHCGTRRAAGHGGPPATREKDRR